MKHTLTVIILFWTVLACAGDRNYEPATEDVVNRTRFWLPEEPITGAGISKEAFVAQWGNKPRPVAIYTHGCGGTNWLQDQSVVRTYLSMGYAVVYPKFILREGVAPSCTKPWPANNPETVNPRRMEARLSDLYAIQDWVTARVPVEHWIVSGHSEGGRTVATWTRPVRAVIIYGMDCKVPFWEIPRGQATLIFHDVRDPWIEIPGRNSQRCATWLNKSWVTEIESDLGTHDPLPTEDLRRQLTQWLTR